MRDPSFLGLAPDSGWGVDYEVGVGVGEGGVENTEARLGRAAQMSVCLPTVQCQGCPVLGRRERAQSSEHLKLTQLNEPAIGLGWARD